MSSPVVPAAASGLWRPPTAEELQVLLPQFEITSLLGRGGMGAVYKGRQIALDRQVAVKVLSRAGHDADGSFAARFKNEAKAMARLMHPGIVTVFDFGETAEGLLYMVMEYIEGTDVSRMIEDSESGRLPADHAVAITAHVCDALAYAHERGIIHRDIKPANIMVGMDGVVKVADFGLAKLTKAADLACLTQSGMALGTLQYMAPEALTLHSNVDERADVYAVGVMFYQMLTGKLPHGVFKMPSALVPGLEPRYDRIISKALREDRQIRYQSIAEVRRELDLQVTRPVAKLGPERSEAPAALPTGARPMRRAEGPGMMSGVRSQAPASRAGQDGAARANAPDQDQGLRAESVRRERTRDDLVRPEVSQRVRTRDSMARPMIPPAAAPPAAPVRTWRRALSTPALVGAAGLVLAVLVAWQIWSPAAPTNDEPRSRSRPGSRAEPSSAPVLAPLGDLAGLPPGRPVERHVAAAGQGYFPVALRLDDGRIAMVMRGGVADEGIDGRLDIIFSQDEGRTWTPPATVADTAMDDRSPAFGQTQDGALVLVWWKTAAYDRDGNLDVRLDKHHSTQVVRSFDGGKTWSDPEELDMADIGHGCPYGRIETLPGGRLLMAVNGREARSGDQKRGGAFNRSYVYQSLDGGGSWKRLSEIGDGGRTEFYETSLLRLPDGRIKAALRNRLKSVWVAESVDGGLTWSRPDLLTPAGVQPADLCLLRDGRILLTAGCRTGPYGVLGVISDARGQFDWNQRFALMDDAGSAECGFPSSVLLKDGRVMTAYYATSLTGTPGRGLHCGVLIHGVAER